MASESAVVSEVKPQPETKSQKGAATRDQILDAASRLIHVHGYQSTSLDDVLRESGVGKGNFYYYFKSKEDLGYAIIDRDPARLPRAHAGAGLRRRRRRSRSTRSALPRSACWRPSGSATAWAAARWAISPPSCPTCTRASAQRLAGIFDAGAACWRTAIAREASEAAGSARTRDAAARWRNSWWRRSRAPSCLAKVTKDIAVMEQCVGELKRYLTLYEEPSMTTLHAPRRTSGHRGTAPRKRGSRTPSWWRALRRQEPGRAGAAGRQPSATASTGWPSASRATRGRRGSGPGRAVDGGPQDRHLQGRVGLRQLALPDHRQRGLPEAPQRGRASATRSRWTTSLPALRRARASTSSRWATGRPASRSRRCRASCASVLTTAIDDLPRRLPDRVPAARRRGAVEPRDRRDAAASACPP